MEKGSLDSKATVASLNLNIDKLNKMIEKEKTRNEQLQVWMLSIFDFYFCI